MATVVKQKRNLSVLIFCNKSNLLVIDHIIDIFIESSLFVTCAITVTVVYQKNIIQNIVWWQAFTSVT